MKVSHVILFFLFGVAYGHPSGLNSDQPTVITKFGRIEGVRKSIANGSCEEFLGIRYGKIPKRFSYSMVNNDSWEGILYATNYGPKCIQEPSEGSSEDCLYINIWRPEMNESSLSDPLPVLVWVHGSAYQHGSGAQTPGDVFAATGPVIMATINYRLGAFGYVYGDADELPGNQGISDVVTALKWVRENIGYFNGDPSKVTLAGHSAGSMISSTFPVLPMIDHSLYSRIFIMSGVSVSPMYIENTTVAIAKTKRLAEKVGCGPVSEGPLTKRVIECLQTVNTSILLEKNQETDIKDIGGAEVASFIPVYGTPFIPMPLIDLFWSSYNTTSHQITIINGVAKDESASFWGYLHPKTREEACAMAWEKLSFIKKNLTVEEMNPFYDHYFNGTVDGDEKSLRTSLTNFMNDYSFRCTSLGLSEVYSNRHFVHFAEFDYVIDKYGPKERPDGPWHPDSIEIFFGDPLRPVSPTKDDSNEGSYSERDAETSIRLMKKLISFVSGDNHYDWPLVHFDRSKPYLRPTIREINFTDSDVKYDKQSICVEWSKLLGFDITKY